MTVKLLTEQHLEFLNLKGGCLGSSESTLVKMPRCWKSHLMVQGDTFCMLGNLACFLSSAEFWCVCFFFHLFLFFFKIMTDKMLNAEIKHQNKQT